MTERSENRISGEGWLALTASPIGNLEDITYRAVRILGAADLIAAEDTRRARRLLAKYAIDDTRLTSYHAYNEDKKTESLLDQVERGRKIAVLSDAGTPAISDPGFLIVRAAVSRGIEPLVVPGVSALSFAVVAAGFPVDKFMFAGFPPVKPGKRKRFLEQLPISEYTCFLFEGPHRIPRLLVEISEIIGPQVPVALIREATKVYEEVIRGTASQLAEDYAGRKCRGEFTIAISR